MGMRWLSVVALAVVGCAGGSTELDSAPADSSVLDARADGGDAAEAATDATDGAPTTDTSVAVDSATDSAVEAAADSAVEVATDSAMDTAPADAGPCSASSPCAAGLTCCSGVCVDTKTTLDHCGKCGDKCTVINGAGKCVDGACEVSTCNVGWGDCDGDKKSCEASTTLEITNCGGCGIKCTLSDATPACVEGKCAVASCAPGYGDCDKKPENGCEVNLATDVANCGACGAKPAELCNGKDDDCDGVADDGFACVLGAAPSTCTTTCGTTGVQTCSSSCSHVCTPPAETCNVADDDCNGKCDDVAGCRVAVHRTYKSSTGEHFYTTSETEGPGAGFAMEFKDYYFLYSGVQPGLVPFYRCWVPGVSMHFYTQSSTCEGQVVEGSMGYIATTAVCGAVPLYRMAHKTNGDHFYTTSATERDAALPSYVDEGIAGYVWPATSG